MERDQYERRIAQLLDEHATLQRQLQSGGGGAIGGMSSDESQRLERKNRDLEDENARLMRASNVPGQPGLGQEVRNA